MASNRAEHRSTPELKRRSSPGSGLWLGGLVAGVALGAISGLLLAPRRGRETRRLLQQSAQSLPGLVDDLSSTVQVQAGRLSSAALDRWEETLDRLRLALAAGLEASVGLESASEESDDSPPEGLRRHQPPQTPAKQLRYNQLSGNGSASSAAGALASDRTSDRSLE